MWIGRVVYAAGILYVRFGKVEMSVRVARCRDMEMKRYEREQISLYTFTGLPDLWADGDVTRLNPRLNLHER